MVHVRVGMIGERLKALDLSECSGEVGMRRREKGTVQEGANKKDNKARVTCEGQGQAHTCHSLNCSFREAHLFANSGVVGVGLLCSRIKVHEL